MSSAVAVLTRLFCHQCSRRLKDELRHLHTAPEILAAKRKQVFHNKYIAQLKKRFRVDNSFAHDIIQRQDERTREPNDDVDETDFQDELLREAQRRRSAYKHWKKIKDFNKGPGPRLLTWKQMEHARFLRQTNPDEWNVETLAYSFQVPQEVMRKVLHSKNVLSPEERERLDAKVRENRGIGKLPSPLYKTDTDNKSVVLFENEKNQNIAPKEQTWGLPDWKNVSTWFDGYEKGSVKLSDKKLTRRPANSEGDSGVSWIDDDDCEFYAYLYNEEDEWQDMEEEKDEEYEEIEDLDEETDSLNIVKTNDGKTFYNEDDEFLYRL
uniref:neugrin-like n=1 Tax=Styela clava TaxID=7725 RepID=UPI00193AD866|nr:neugrin-like [Styela clava]